MFAASLYRPVILLAAVLIASPVLAAPPDTSSPPSAPKQDDAAPPAPPVRMMPPGYNPGEMLKGLANPVVAEVEGHPITLAEVGDAIRALPANMQDLPFEQLYPGVLERLIQEQALVAKARRMRLDADPVVKRRMQAASDRVLENELLNRMIGKTISEQALLARYQSQYGGKQGPEEVDISVIKVPSEDQARKIIAEIAGGADFAAVAKRDSKDPSADNGGGLGFMRQSQLIPEVGAVALELEPGQVSPNPVKTQAGWFVVKVNARKRVPVPAFAEVREQLRHELLEEGVAQVVKDVMATSTILRFNMNGTSVAKPTDDQ